MFVPLPPHRATFNIHFCMLVEFFIIDTAMGRMQAFSFSTLNAFDYSILTMSYSKKKPFLRLVQKGASLNDPLKKCRANNPQTLAFFKSLND